MKIQDCLETDVELINKTMFGNGRNTNDKWDIVCVCLCARRSVILLFLKKLNWNYLSIVVMTLELEHEDYAIEA